MPKRTRTESGVAVIEFALLSLIWVPLLLGTIFFGAELIRAMELVQLAKDVGHMYARKVDFSLTANQDMVVDLGQNLNFKTAGGDAVIILTTVEYISATECPSGCANKNHWVLTHQLIIGASTLRKSAYTNDSLPAADFEPPGSGKVKGTLYLTNTELQLHNFNLITVDSGGFRSGDLAYLVEAFVKSTPVPGIRTNPGIYSQMLF